MYRIMSDDYVIILNVEFFFNIVDVVYNRFIMVIVVFNNNQVIILFDEFF